MKFWRDAFGVAGGTALAQALGLAGYVLLARIFPVSAFGEYATWVAVTAIIATFVSGALETTFVQEDDGQPRRSALIAVLATAAIGAVAVTLVVAVVAGAWPGVFPDMEPAVLYALGAGGLALSSCTVFQSWASASGHFRSLIGNRIFQSLAITLIPSAGGLFSATAEVMVLGHLTGLVLTSVLWIFVLRPRAEDLSYCGKLWTYWKGRRRTFAMVLPALAVGSVAGNIPLLATQSRFGPVAAGHLALTLRALGAPITLVGVALRDVFKRHASVAFRERGECRAEYRTTLATLAVVAIGFALFMIVAGEFVFVLVFGEEWRMAGTMAIWLLPGYSFAIVAAPLSYLIYIVRREDVDLYWQSGMLVLALAAMLLSPDLQTALIAYSLAAAAMYLIYIVVCYRMAAGTVGSPTD